MNLRRTLGAWLASMLAVTACSVAVAGPISREFGPNLVTNGSFENTALLAASGWTATGFSGEGFDFLIDSTAADAEQGNRSFAGGGVGGLGFISQDLVTVPGVDYNIHIWLANLSGFADGTAIQVLWAGNVVYSATDILGFGYRESHLFNAAGAVLRATQKSAWPA